MKYSTELLTTANYVLLPLIWAACSNIRYAAAEVCALVIVL